VTKPVAIYARFSTDKQDKRSIEDQVRRCRDFAARENLTVVEVYSDEGKSGTNIKRAGYQLMLADARSARRPFVGVLVDDQSRLSRDLLDYLLLERTLRSAGVEIIDRATGRSSDDKGAKTLRVFNGLINEVYVDDLRDKTRRGLEGRAHNDLHTGGRCYGYTTEAHENPSDPRRPFHRLKVEEVEARLVRRIFAAYAEGAGHRQIAAALNAEGVPAPYDRRPRREGGTPLQYQKLAGRGWSGGTIRSMLRNERYIGKLTYNRREGFKDALTKQQKYRERPKKEWITKERPDLRIVDDLLWRKVQRRIGRREKRALGTPRQREGRPVSPLSGLLWCGVCGSRMAAAGNGKGGLYRNFKCAANHVKGREVCSNSVSIAEGKTLVAVSVVLSTTLDLLENDGAFQRFTATFRRLLSARTRATATPPAELSDVEARIRQESARVENAVEALLASPRSDALSRALNEAEARLKALEEKRDGMQRPVAASKVPMPSPARLRELFGEVEAALQGSPEEAQRVLAARLGRVTLTPKDTAEGPVYLLETTLKTEPAALLEDSRSSTLLDGCGARI